LSVLLFCGRAKVAQGGAEGGLEAKMEILVYFVTGDTFRDSFPVMS
jgi:hypothetical protein